MHKGASKNPLELVRELGNFGEQRWGVARPEQAYDCLETLRIPVDEETQLAARLWLPDSAHERPVGVVLEWVPYRLRDITRGLDDVTGGWLAGAGFGFVRIDVRGTGESDGSISDEFEDLQTDDLIAAIEWLAKQSWCNGSIGVRGYSWGGNAALYAAARAPEPLKAVVACCACGDRFARDLHWTGGAATLTNVKWAAYYNSVVALPPDPAVVGDRWRDLWKTRLEAIGETAATWTEHQRADDYWAVSSPAVDYPTIDTPVYAVGGQLDGFVDELDHLMRGLRGPRKALMGPWGHSFPHEAVPGPRVDWLEEESRWWAHWLHEEDNGIMAEPMVRAYVQDESPVQAPPGADIAGHWVSLDGWPSERSTATTLYLADGRLSSEPSPAQRHTVPNDGLVGLTWREWSAPDKGAADMPQEQSDDDALSRLFDSDPLTEPMVLLGCPQVRLRVVSDQPVATVAVRLSEVSADGRSWPVSFGLMNLTHRGGSTDPRALVPGEATDVVVPLRVASRRLQSGSRIRLAVSGTMWPMVVTPPLPVRLSLETGAESALVLPTLDVMLPSPSELEGGAAVAADHDAIEIRDEVDPDGRRRITKTTHYSTQSIGAPAVIAGYGDECVMEIDQDTGQSSRWSMTCRRELERSGQSIRIDSCCETVADATHFEVSESLTAREDGAVVFERSTTRRIPRILC